MSVQSFDDFFVSINASVHKLSPTKTVSSIQINYFCFTLYMLSGIQCLHLRVLQQWNVALRSIKCIIVKCTVCQKENPPPLLILSLIVDKKGQTASRPALRKTLKTRRVFHQNNESREIPFWKARGAFPGKPYHQQCIPLTHKTNSKNWTYFGN